MYRRWLATTLCFFCLTGVSLACTSQNDKNSHIPTPAAEVLQVHSTITGTQLRVTLPSIKFPKRNLEDDVQLFLMMTNAQTDYTYLLYPANRSGDNTEQLDLTTVPLELGINDEMTAVTLWILAVHNTRYAAAERFGLDALAAILGIGFHTWLIEGDPADDPLAAIISASNETLYEWFAEIEVLGQTSITLTAENNWNIGLNPHLSSDGGLNIVYTVQHIPAGNNSAIPTDEHPGYVIRLDETFEDETATHTWYEGQDNTYVNEIVDDAYQISLTDIIQREVSLSWGSIENERFEHYLLEATIHLVEEAVTGGQYGIWFHYQDDYNFIYFGISNQGEYRVSIVQSNTNRKEIQNWTPHPAIRRGAATNVLTIETGPDNTMTLGVNGETLTTFEDHTFESGSIAFFCRAKSVPATCRLEQLRIWEMME